MSRKHLFPLVVLLAAAAVAGILALTQTVDLGRASQASTASDPAIGFRLEQLDRFEASLRSRLAKTAERPASAPQTVYRRAASLTAQGGQERDEHEHESDRYEHEDGERDD
jgi:hypothetical protein